MNANVRCVASSLRKFYVQSKKKTTKLASVQLVASVVAVRLKLQLRSTKMSTICRLVILAVILKIDYTTEETDEANLVRIDERRAAVRDDVDQLQPFIEPDFPGGGGGGLGRWSTWGSWGDCACETRARLRFRYCRRLPGNPKNFQRSQASLDGLTLPESQRRPFLVEPTAVNSFCPGSSRQSQSCSPSGCESDSTPPEGGLATQFTNGVKVYRLNKAIRIILSEEARKYKRCIDSQNVGSNKGGTVSFQKGVSNVAKRNQCRKQTLASRQAASSRQGTSASVVAKTSVTGCTNLPPFFNQLRSGLDVSVLDVYSTSPSNGIENTVLTVTCDFGSQIEIQGVLYNLPDQATSFYESNIQELFSSSDRIQTSSQVKESKHDEFGLSASYASYFSFSGSYSYKRMQTQLRQSDDYHYRFKYQAASFVFPLDFDIPLDLNESPGGASAFIRSRLLGSTYASNPRPFQDFVTIYGTHALYRASLGGVVETSVSIGRLYTSKKTSSEVKRQAELSVLSFLKSKGATTTTTETADQRFTASSRLQARCFGGNAAGGCGSLSIPEWANSVPSHPHLLGGESLPITSFVSDVGLQNNLEIAICRHLALSYLNDIIARIDSILRLNTLQVQVRQQFANTLSQARNLLASLTDNAQAGLHQAKCNEVKNQFALASETLIELIREGGVQVVPLGRVNYDAPMDQTCPDDYVIGRIKGQYDDHYKDRQWDNECRRSTFRLFQSCQWTPNYVNQYKQKFTYQCPSKGAITGLRSVHSGGHNEDRIWQFRCCQLAPATVQRCTISCSKAGSFTTVKAPFDLQPPSGNFFSGFETDVWHYVKRRLFRRRRYYTDRKWKPITCRVDSCS